MSLPTTIPQAILDTILGHLANLFLFGAAYDSTTAHQAATQMLAAYHVETEEELALAAEIISFRLHTLEALSHATDPELSLNKILRLRGGAVSLSREAHKSQRKLDQLQRDRRAGIKPQPAATQTEAPARPKIEQALDLIETAGAAPPTEPKTSGKITWSQSFQKRQMAQRIAENSKKNQAHHASQATHRNAAAADAQGIPQPL